MSEEQRLWDKIRDMQLAVKHKVVPESVRGCLPGSKTQQMGGNLRRKKKIVM